MCCIINILLGDLFTLIRQLLDYISRRLDCCARIDHDDNNNNNRKYFSASLGTKSSRLTSGSLRVVRGPQSGGPKGGGGDVGGCNGDYGDPVAAAELISKSTLKTAYLQQSTSTGKTDSSDSNYYYQHNSGTSSSNPAQSDRLAKLEEQQQLQQQLSTRRAGLPDRSIYKMMSKKGLLKFVKYTLIFSNAFGFMLSIFLGLFGVAYPDKHFPLSYKGSDMALCSLFCMLFTTVGYCGAKNHKRVLLIVYGATNVIIVIIVVILWLLFRENSILGNKEVSNMFITTLAVTIAVMFLFSFILAFHINVFKDDSHDSVISQSHQLLQQTTAFLQQQQQQLARQQQQQHHHHLHQSNVHSMIGTAGGVGGLGAVGAGLIPLVNQSIGVPPGGYHHQHQHPSLHNQQQAASSHQHQHHHHHHQSDLQHRHQHLALNQHHLHHSSQQLLHQHHQHPHLGATNEAIILGSTQSSAGPLMLTQDRHQMQLGGAQLHLQQTAAGSTRSKSLATSSGQQQQPLPLPPPPTSTTSQLHVQQVHLPAPQGPATGQQQQQQQQQQPPQQMSLMRNQSSPLPNTYQSASSARGGGGGGGGGAGGGSKLISAVNHYGQSQKQRNNPPQVQSPPSPPSPPPPPPPPPPPLAGASSHQQVSSSQANSSHHHHHHPHHQSLRDHRSQGQAGNRLPPCPVQYCTFDCE